MERSLSSGVSVGCVARVASSRCNAAVPSSSARADAITICSFGDGAH
jgi:hypothetical protein